MYHRGLLAMFLGIACVLGCNSDASQKVPGRSVTVKASGNVTLNGKPVEGAIVMFNSEQLNLTAYGKSDSSGHFQLTTYESGDGAPVGHYRVVIKKVEHAVTGESDHPALPPMTELSLGLPEKYAQWETSGLNAVVVEGGENSYSFDLSESPEAL